MPLPRSWVEKTLSSVTLGVLGAWAGVLSLFLFFFAAAHDKLASVWELLGGAVGYLPAWLLLAAPLGALGGFLGGPRPDTSPRWPVRGLTVGALYGAAVGYGVGGGRHLATLPLRLGFAAVVAGISALGFAVLSRWIERRAPERLALGPALSAALLLGLGLEWLSAHVLVRLYPAFHAGLSALALGASGFAVARARASAPNDVRSRAFAFIAVPIVLCACAASLVPGARSVLRLDNLRWALLETSPSLAWGVELGALVAPPPELDEAALGLPLGAPRAPASLSWRGRSILLVTVDALRADHVGAYGYQRPTTPALDRLAQEGVLFERAYAPTPHTSYSVTSLMTGKYMRPLLAQGVGVDSDLWAGLLRTYGYRSAAFYPPAVFFIDKERFTPFEQAHLGFEYFKVEFAEGQERLTQLADYLRATPPEAPVFVWLHLFGPHEPYVQQPGFSFGERDIDRYDSEVAAADWTLGQATRLLRARDPEALVIVTADHGEEFGEHGGRYHGTTLFEEQIRVPLVLAAPGLAAGRRVTDPVQTIDLLPTVLSGLSIPIPPRIRGRDLGAYLSPTAAVGSGAPGTVLAETDELTLVAEGTHRLICHRRSGACRLFDLEKDPKQTEDRSSQEPEILQRLRQQARALAGSHGRFESNGLRQEGRGLPAPIVRGLSGDVEAAPELALLLEDADVHIRERAAEALHAVASTAQAPALRLALAREESQAARAWMALTLTRLGQTAPLVYDLLLGPDARFRRLAALALAEAGDGRGSDELLAFWLAPEERSFEDDQRLLAAFARLKPKAAVGPLIRRLGDVRLRPFIAATLAAIGDTDARPALASALARERYQSARAPLARALLELRGKNELVLPLRHFLGVPDPLPDGLEIATLAGILPEIGGPTDRALGRLRQLADSAVGVDVVVPPLPRGEPSLGVRLLVRARTRPGALSGRVHVAPKPPRIAVKDDETRAHHQPEISGGLSLVVPAGAAFAQVGAELPPSFGARPGALLGLALLAEGGVEVDSVAVVPLRAEIPPPPPEPWEKTGEGPSDSAPPEAE